MSNSSFAVLLSASAIKDGRSSTWDSMMPLALSSRKTHSSIEGFVEKTGVAVEMVVGDAVEVGVGVVVVAVPLGVDTFILAGEGGFGIVPSVYLTRP